MHSFFSLLILKTFCLPRGYRQFPVYLVPFQHHKIDCCPKPPCVCGFLLAEKDSIANTDLHPSLGWVLTTYISLFNCQRRCSSELHHKNRMGPLWGPNLDCFSVTLTLQWLRANLWLLSLDGIGHKQCFSSQ